MSSEDMDSSNEHFHVMIVYTNIELAEMVPLELKETQYHLLKSSIENMWLWFESCNWNHSLCEVF